MANFKTHMVIGAIASTGLAAVSLGINEVEVKHAVAFGMAGTLGGILPDIDSDNSFAIGLVFTFIAVVLAMLFVSRYYDSLPLLHVFGIGAGAFLAVRYVARYIFEKLTVHRGIFHSLLAAVMMGFATMTMVYYLMSLNELLCWLSGIFVTFGYLVHLLLDEIYSVDLVNVRVKRSFGTAIKPFSVANPIASVFTLAVTVGLIWISPSSDQFTSSVFNSQSYEQFIKLFAG